MNIEICLNRYFWLILLALLIINLFISLHLRNIAPFEERKLLFVPEPQYVERICGTFRNSVALMFYMKGAQELAYHSSKKFDLLIALFRLTLYLDPKILQAAFLGGIVAPTRYRNIPKAIELLKEAEARLPNEWHIPYWIGFNYLQISEYEKAASYYKKAAKLPNALPFLETASVHILSRGKDLSLAIAEAERILASSKDQDTIDLMKLRLDWLKTMQFLENVNRQFKKKFGRYPQRLQELVEKGMLSKLPQDEFGEGFYLVHPGDCEKGYMVRSDF